MSNHIPNFAIQKKCKNQATSYHCPYCNSIMLGFRESPDKVKIIRCQNQSCKKLSLTLKNNEPIMIKYEADPEFLLVWHGNAILSIGTVKSDFANNVISTTVCKAKIGSTGWHEVLNKVNADTVERIQKLKIFK